MVVAAAATAVAVVRVAIDQGLLSVCSCAASRSRNCIAC